jgi:hypothetical protein
MSGSMQFTVPATEEALAYLEKIADAMELLYGISREAAIGKINQAYVEANECAARARRDAAAGRDTEDAKAISRIDAFGGSGGFDLTSDLSVALLTHELPEFWARLIYSGERSHEPMHRRSSD